MTLHRNVTLDAANPQMLEIVHRCLYDSSNGKSIRVFNVYHFITDNPSTYATKGAYGTAFQSFIDAQLMPLVCAPLVSDAIWVRFLDDPTDMYDELPDTTPGGVATDGLPIYVCATFQIKTGLRGRNFKGSKHYGPIPEASTTKDELSGAALTNWQTFAAALQNIALDDGSANYARLILLSKSLSSLPPIGPQVVTYAEATEVTCNTSLGTLRRRSEVRSHGA